MLPFEPHLVKDAVALQKDAEFHGRKKSIKLAHLRTACGKFWFSNLSPQISPNTSQN
jgi:hypothetical protein